MYVIITIVGDVRMELLRVVDRNGVDTYNVLEREELHNKGMLHNEVVIYIINKKGEVLLQRRSKNRRFSPNKLGVIAGHVSHNERALTAAVRECREEVGLVVEEENMHVLCPRYLVIEEYNNHFMYPYYTYTEKDANDFIIQKEELDYVRWYKIDDVIDMIKKGSSEVLFKTDEIKYFLKLKDVIQF